MNPLVQKQQPRVRSRARGSRSLLATAAAAAWLALAVPAGAASILQARPAGAGAAEHAARGDARAAEAGQPHAPEGAREEHGEEHASESPWGTIGRVFNFAVLAGALVYLLRSPFASYLRGRAVTIRADLRKAAELREAASRQMAEIEGRMRALPDEIRALTRRGAEEIAAEEARIHAAAESERQRMLQQARREIDLQVLLAQRALRRRAGELAVDLATERVRRSIGDADHARLVDRYLAQVQPRVVGERGRPS